MLPILTYAWKPFGYEKTQMLESVHLEVFRKMAHLRKGTPNYMLYADFGRHPIKIIIKQKMLNFWTTILNAKTFKFSQIYF